VDRDVVAQVAAARALIHIVDEDAAVEVVLLARGRIREAPIRVAGDRSTREGREVDLDLVQRDSGGRGAGRLVDVHEQLEARLGIEYRWRGRISGPEVIRGVGARALRDVAHLDGVCPGSRLRVELGNVLRAGLRDGVVALLRGTSPEAIERVERTGPGAAEGSVRVAEVADERAGIGGMVHLSPGPVVHLDVDGAAVRN